MDPSPERIRLGLELELGYIYFHIYLIHPYDTFIINLLLYHTHI